MELTSNEIKRYKRHLLLPEFGPEGQLKLKKAKVLLVGAGGLGSPSAIYLAAAGVGTLGIIDADKVDYSNLQRQIIHFTDDVGTSKVASAKDKINRLNPEVDVHVYETRLNSSNALDVIKDYDLVIDGTDNFPSRYLINDACIMLKKPFVYGGIYRFEGQCSVFGLSDGPCYRCFFQEPPKANEVPSCAEAGVLGVLPGIIGLLQSNEAIKILTQIGRPLKGRLLLFDALETQFREIKIAKDPSCPMCGKHRTIHELKEYEHICGDPSAIEEISVKNLKELLDQSPDIYILDVREEAEVCVAKLPTSIVKPLSTLETTYHDIPKDKTVYVHCKLGGRSAKAIQFLRAKGYTNLINIAGGINAWAEEIDPGMVKY
ncbi:MAG: molybdopterin-synthase adenylyltransferase MoeB [Candidatus Omnitrophica bacterium]|nr:molybdopterin-synthase adenylyltransferase MoeB [Candidatus Omnitrophota bacterium]